MKLGLMTKSECIDFFEFNISGDNDNFNKCDSESLYLNSSIFNILASCFEQSNYLFEFEGQTKYNSRKLIPLLNELTGNLRMISTLTSLDEFKNYITKIFLGRNMLQDLAQADPDWERCWIFYLRKLILINRSLIDLVEKCIDEERILWVIGY